MKQSILSTQGLILLVTTVFSLHAQASDVAKEKRWAEQIVDSIMTGDAQWLQADGHKFLSIYTPATTDKTIGGAIVIHGIGVHPNWADVVLPLRTRLPDRGWHTLSLQMPVLRNEADYKDYKPLFPEIAPRINAGIDFLKAKGITNIVIIGHSMGATMAAYYVANTERPEVKALVSIGATGLMFKDSKLDIVQSLKKIKTPILDLSGSDDLPGVLKTKTLKANTAKAAGNKHYQQIEIQGANHFLVGKEDETVKVVGDWIKKYGS
ncbi:MAG: hypothetical protein BMS9Abin36_2158 [Gammaproteobacteria bacterium]|nr:MAG: hypothetical protein BMS9Abin36_2158 [Gammaproteobacteria bacterium]